MPALNFPKKYRLCNHKTIDLLFGQPDAVFFEFPLRFCCRAVAPDTLISNTQVLFVVPKKKLHKATQRNLIKRRLREAYRHKLADFTSGNLLYSIAVVYTSSNIESYAAIHKSVNLILEQFNAYKYRLTHA